MKRYLKIFYLLSILLVVSSCKEDTTTADINNHKYILHSKITSTIFWVGEESSDENGYIPNIASAWDESWMFNYGGVDDPNYRDGYHPEAFTPLQNPFYFALPYNDISIDGEQKDGISSYIPWYYKTDKYLSLCKNRWIKITKDDKTVYAQWEDVGPFYSDDKEYVFGYKQPLNSINNHAGIDLSPAVRDYLLLKDIDTVDWQFVDIQDVPDGPWMEIVTKSYETY